MSRENRLEMEAKFIIQMDDVLGLEVFNNAPSSYRLKQAGSGINECENRGFWSVNSLYLGWASDGKL